MAELCSSLMLLTGTGVGIVGIRPGQEPVLTAHSRLNRLLKALMMALPVGFCHLTS